jgi:hypothetical protein
MKLEAIGIFALLGGAYIAWRGPGQGMALFLLASLLGAAAVVKLPALGDASITPGHILLVFVAASVAIRPAYRHAALRSIAVPGPGVILLAVVAYGLLSAVFLPRIFAGATDVYSLARSPDGQSRIVITTLTPRSSNITQSLYLLANLVCFAVLAAYARINGAARLVNLMVLVAGANLLFAAIDIATFATGTAELLAFMRNANYAILEDGEIAGLKRIIGSFTEASSYGYATIGLFAFTARLWLAGERPRATGPIAAALLATLVLSTSTTAYAALAALSIFMLGGCAIRLAQGEATKRDTIVLFAVPPIAICVLFAAMLTPAVWTTILEAADRTVFNKLESHSGVERSRWNEQALQSFVDTNGFGAGVGSVRASSYLVALAANTGVIGTLLALGFVAALPLWAQRLPRRSREGGYAAAGAMACGAMVISAAISAGGTDLTLLFFMFAAVAAATTTEATAATPPKAHPASLTLTKGAPA